MGRLPSSVCGSEGKVALKLSFKLPQQILEFLLNLADILHSFVVGVIDTDTRDNYSFLQRLFTIKASLGITVWKVESIK